MSERWEYRVENWRSADLNALGMDGWELVCATPAVMRTGFIFKRRLPPRPAEEP